MRIMFPPPLVTIQSSIVSVFQFAGSPAIRTPGMTGPVAGIALDISMALAVTAIFVPRPFTGNAVLPASARALRAIEETGPMAIETIGSLGFIRFRRGWGIGRGRGRSGGLLQPRSAAGEKQQ
jgi:hypothetical protein